MKVLIVLLVAVACTLGSELLETNYHENIGIPLARRIKAIEESKDFDGATAGGRIFNGSPAQLGAHPHLGGLVIQLSNGRESVCGSSLVSTQAVLTAAHCMREGNNLVRGITVVLASTTLFYGGTRRPGQTLTVHASYNPNTLNNDIGIVRIQPVSLNNHIQVIALPVGHTNNNFAGTWATAAGFGTTSDNAGIGWNQFQSHVDLQIITNNVCQQTYGGSTVISSTLCCNANGRSTCPGDSGGPLSAWVGNQRLLLGVVSFGSINGCTRGFPVGFARTTSFISWIQSRL